MMLVCKSVSAAAWRRLDRVPEEALPWLLACAPRLLANQRLGAARMDALVNRLATSASASSVDEPTDLVGTALMQLGERDREVLLLSAGESLVPAQIAMVLGCSRTAAAVRLHRARRRLAAAVAHGGDDSSSRQTAEVIP